MGEIFWRLPCPKFQWNSWLVSIGWPGRVNVCLDFRLSSSFSSSCASYHAPWNSLYENTGTASLWSTQSFHASFGSFSILPITLLLAVRWASWGQASWGKGKWHGHVCYADVSFVELATWGLQCLAILVSQQVTGYWGVWFCYVTHLHNQTNTSVFRTKVRNAV